MRIMRHLSVIAIFLCLTQAVQAASLCRFTVACLEDEPCAETSFTMQLRGGTGGPNEIELVTDAETIGVAVGGNGRVAHLAGMTDSGFHILTVTRETGAARYTNHVDAGPLTVSYIGSCEMQ
jgi:hypothetical protein